MKCSYLVCSLGGKQSSQGEVFVQTEFAASAIVSMHGTPQSTHSRAVIPEQSSQGMFVVSVAVSLGQLLDVVCVKLHINCT